MRWQWALAGPIADAIWTRVAMRVAQDVPLAHCTAAAARPVGCVRVLCAYCARRVYALCARGSRSHLPISLMDHTKYVRRLYRAILRQLVYSVLVSNMTMSRIKACRCRAMYSAPAHTVGIPRAPNALTGGRGGAHVGGRLPESAATILRV